MNKNERLEEIRKNTPQEIKDGVDELVKAIDRAYYLGYHDAKQKLNIHGVVRPASASALEGEPLGNEAWEKGVCVGCGIEGFVYKYAFKKYCENCFPIPPPARKSS
jgi:hypothetical protein